MAGRLHRHLIIILPRHNGGYWMTRTWIIISSVPATLWLATHRCGCGCHKFDSLDTQRKLICWPITKGVPVQALPLVGHKSASMGDTIRDGGTVVSVPNLHSTEAKVTPPPLLCRPDLGRQFCGNFKVCR